MKLGGAGGSKTLAWGFAMAPHQLRILVFLLPFNGMGMCIMANLLLNGQKVL